MREINGDIIALAKKGHFDVIVHGCNCFNTMNNGVAKQIRTNFPEAYLVDKATERGDKAKLGTFTYCRHSEWFLKDVKFSDGSPLKVPDVYCFYVINAYTQYRYGRGRDLFEYSSLRTFLYSFGNFLFILSKVEKKSSFRVGFPRLGTGLAGGDWERIKKDLKWFSEKNSDICDLTIVNYEKLY